jgi:dihydroorotate dehydrogenase
LSKKGVLGVGGVFTGGDAYEKIKAGASVVQIYTSLVYEGPPVVTKIKQELSQLLAKDGYNSISEAVGRSAQ